MTGFDKQMFATSLGQNALPPFGDSKWRALCARSIGSRPSGHDRTPSFR
jgi:hypothetical protein